MKMTSVKKGCLDVSLEVFLDCAYTSQPIIFRLARNVQHETATSFTTLWLLFNVNIRQTDID